MQAWLYVGLGMYKVWHGTFDLFPDYYWPSPAAAVRSTLGRLDEDWKPESGNTGMPATGG